MNSILKSLTLALVLLAATKTFSATGNGPKCKVNDPDISTHYSGGCKNGLANGKGVARGRDKYRGNFVDGEIHGWGIYIHGKESPWSTEQFEGWHNKGNRSGYGVSSIAVDKTNHPYYEGYVEKATTIEGRFYIKGLWSKNAFVFSCSSEKDCIDEYVASTIKLEKFALELLNHCAYQEIKPAISDESK